MLRIGLTGGIASGKSTVADYLAELGAAIIDTDVIARAVVEPGSAALDEIREQFGDDVLNADGTLNREEMRRIVFTDNARRHALESILHPRIRDETLRQADVVQGPYQVIVVPLLVDSPLQEFVDRILVVDCDPDEQLRRLLQRDVGDQRQAKRIIAAQASRDDRLAIADDVIDNSGTLAETRERVAQLHRFYLQLAERSL
ncbi:MAG: dephospho-CoA kinase [Gammaproteobacteria bacterium]|nr:dephospho-CoA kinase [Gammaproteobacteria bacterium]